MVVNVFLLGSLTALVMHTSSRLDAATANAATGQGSATAGPAINVPGDAALPANIPSKAQITAVSGKYFGVAAPGMPWSSNAGSQIAQTAGTPPDMVEYFVNWTQDFSVAAAMPPSTPVRVTVPRVGI